MGVPLFQTVSTVESTVFTYLSNGLEHALSPYLDVGRGLGHRVSNPVSEGGGTES